MAEMKAQEEQSDPVSDSKQNRSPYFLYKNLHLTVIMTLSFIRISDTHHQILGLLLHKTFQVSYSIITFNYIHL